MARPSKVEIDGNGLSNVLEVQYGLRATVDSDGAPTGRLECSGVMIRRVADDSTDLTEWAADANEANRRSGKIVFEDANGLEMKVLEFSGAYIRNYVVEYDDDGDHVEETCVIEPETISVGGDEHFFDWKDK